jgi:hypothetical protein
MSNRRAGRGAIAGQRSRESALGDSAMAVIGPQNSMPPNQTRTSDVPRVVQGLFAPT